MVFVDLLKNIFTNKDLFLASTSQKKGALGLSQLLLIVFLIILFIVVIYSWTSKTGGLLE